MPSLREHAVKPGGIEIALLLMAALWYASFAALFFSGKNGLDEIPWPWLLILAFGPALSAVLAFAMHLALRRYRRPLAVREMILVVFVTPQFLGAVYVWLGLFHYMGLL